MLFGLSLPSLSRRRTGVALACLLALPACAGGGGRPYPSLAHRPIEDIRLDQKDVGAATSAPSPAGVHDPALDRQAADQLAAVEAAARAFQAQLAPARTAVAGAKGAAPGDERWVVAQEAVSRLDQTRSPVTIALATLDNLRIEAAHRSPPVDTHMLDDAWTRARAVQEDQDAAVTALSGALPPA